MKQTKFFMQLLLMTVSVYSFTPSGESVNPFNQYMSPTGGINLFSGNVVHSYPLFSLVSKNGVNFPVALGYSSNVDLNARAKNTIAPAGFAGLGWQCGFGRIVANHNGTASANDDTYTWISPEGVPFPIYYKNGRNFAVTIHIFQIDHYKQNQLITLKDRLS